MNTSKNEPLQTQTAQTVHAHPEWTDGKRYAWALGLLVPTLPFTSWQLVTLTGMDLFWWYGPIFVFAIVPLIDLLFGTDTSNPPDALIGKLEQDKYYRWCTYLFIPLQYVSLAFACFAWANFDLSFISGLGLAISTGCVNGIAIANAHELGHKRQKLEKRLAIIALAPSFYGHFLVEHNRGHHHRVATPADPASSRLGESFYQFLPRTVIGSLMSAWKLESARLQRGDLPVLSTRNEILRAWSLSVVLVVLLCAVFGIAILPFLVIQGIYGAAMLEVVNYLEHYGLLRQKRANGRYEHCAPQHSWNSNIVASNVLLYHLQRHSDHHANPLRRYQALRHFDESPQLPGGYATMITFAYIPPLWRWLMDKRVVEHYDGDVTKANIHPPSRDRILARWGNIAPSSDMRNS